MANKNERRDIDLLLKATFDEVASELLKPVIKVNFETKSGKDTEFSVGKRRVDILRSVRVTNGQLRGKSYLLHVEFQSKSPNPTAKEKKVPQTPEEKEALAEVRRITKK
jgi:hypothetical protein